MNRPLMYIVGFLGAVVTAVMLGILMEYDFGISPRSIAHDFAGVRWSVRPMLGGHIYESEKVG